MMREKLEVFRNQGKEYLKKCGASLSAVPSKGFPNRGEPAEFAAG